MTRRRKLVATAAAGLVLAGAGGAAIVQASGDDGEGTVTGAQADKARSAALTATKGGEVNAVERDGEKGATWEVEITKPNGKTVDVRLDASYGLVVIDADNEDEGSGEK